METTTAIVLCVLQEQFGKIVDLEEPWMRLFGGEHSVLWSAVPLLLENRLGIMFTCDDIPMGATTRSVIKTIEQKRFAGTHSS